jgi:hypothetical protein
MQADKRLTLELNCQSEDVKILSPHKVDVIVTSATAAIVAAKQATSVIPIVFAAAGDPVGNVGRTTGGKAKKLMAPARLQWRAQSPPAYPARRSKGRCRGVSSPTNLGIAGAPAALPGCYSSRRQQADSSDVAARPRKRRHQSRLKHVFSHGDDRDGAGQPLEQRAGCSGLRTTSGAVLITSATNWSIWSSRMSKPSTTTLRFWPSTKPLRRNSSKNAAMTGG